MEVKQIATLMNTITNEVLGTEDIVMEDLSNIVDVGTQVFNANAVDAYVKSLVNHIGKVIFVDRVYKGTAPSVMMDGWEYGSVLEKITSDALPEATENDSWQLEDGQSYDPHVFHAPKVSAKFFNKKVTFEIDMSFTEIQIKQSFSSPTQLNGFISMIQTSVENSMSVKLDSLIERTINNMIAQTIFEDYKSNENTLGSLTEKSGIKAVNLLYLYNQQYGTDLTVAKSVTTPDFIRFAAYIIGLYKDRLTKMSTLFNVGGKERFTPNDSLHVVLLSEFRRAADVFLQSDTFHEEYTKLVDSEVVPYWQGSGEDYGFAHTSFLHVTTAEGKVVETTGILGIMFDRNALGVSNLDRRTTTAYNPRGEYYNNFYKMDAGYFNDFNENAVVFFVA